MESERRMTMEKELEQMLQTVCSKGIKEASSEEIYAALLQWSKEKMNGMKHNEGDRKLYYISAEFLVGKLLSNNLINLGVFEEVREVLKKHGHDLTEIEEVELTGRHKAILLVFVLAVIWIIYGVVNNGFYLTEMAAVFVVMVVLMGIVAKMSPDDIVASFVKGAGNLLYACICVGFARGLTIIMTEGNILDVIVHGATSVLDGLPALISAPMTFIVVSAINLFIPSGSGKAVIMMPIMVPMADVLGITRQTVALAYHMGDAITNLVTPAGAPLMAALAMANIPWTTWMKFFMKFFIYLMILGSLACVVAITINYGPF